MGSAAAENFFARTAFFEFRKQYRARGELAETQIVDSSDDSFDGLVWKVRELSFALTGEAMPTQGSELKVSEGNGKSVGSDVDRKRTPGLRVFQTNVPQYRNWVSASAQTMSAQMPREPCRVARS